MSWHLSPGSLLIFSLARCRAQSAAQPRSAAHGTLLPAQVTALVSLHNAPRTTAASRQAVGTADPAVRADEAAGQGNAAPATRTPAAAAAAQASNASSFSNGCSSEENAEPVTGLWQRLAAFLYKCALAGEEIGLSDLFDASNPQDPCMGDICALVDIVQRSTSLADAMTRMMEVPVQSRKSQAGSGAASGTSGAADASVNKALRQFHRYRAELDSLYIAAVHLLQPGCLLMLLTCRKNRLMPMVVLYDWEQDAVMFASALYTVKVVVCMMW